jgi:hypothetical protein
MHSNAGVLTYGQEAHYRGPHAHTTATSPRELADE